MHGFRLTSICSLVKEFETPFGPVDEQTKPMQKFPPNFGETIKIIGGLWRT
tara:strand:- start:765 stop:917 length:153 start_codon:yes stop_codon:yes gene_type:complete